MTEQWEKQKREVDSYNVFFSSFKGRNGHKSLFDLGYRLVGVFMRISDNRRGVEAEPDIVLYNGGTLLLVEIKSGQNIDDRAISQMESTNEISVEAGQDFLRNAELEQYSHNNLEKIESLIVYYSDFIDECKEYDGCSEALDELVEYGTVLCQEKGGNLSLAKGEIEDASLRNYLTEGIPLPQLPDTNIYLTENVNREILAYSIAHDCVRTALAREEKITVEADDVIERYRNRELPITKVNDALKFLSKIGAATNSNDEKYTFRQSRMGKIMGVEEHLREISVKNALEDIGAGQQSLDEFAI